MKETTLKTNENGYVVFTNIPIGRYEIEVVGNDFYQSQIKQIEVLKEDDTDQMKFFVGLRQRIDTNV